MTLGAVVEVVQDDGVPAISWGVVGGGEVFR